MTGTVKKIHIFPVKGLNAYPIDTAIISDAGSLVWDRRLAFMDTATGKYINGKNEPNIFRLRCGYDGSPSTVSIESSGKKVSFSLTEDKEKLKDYLAGYFSKDLTLVENAREGIPDDTEASGPTIVSIATLQEVQKWFPGTSIDELFLRFRCNILIDNVPAFWEEQFSGGGTFSIGEVVFTGMYPCARCSVPPLNPYSGEDYKGFQKEFSRMRKAMHPVFLDDKYYEHFYKVTLNTRVSSSFAGKQISVGNSVNAALDRSMEF